MALQNPANLIAQSSCAASVCEACGGKFTCGATLGNCWCEGVELSETVREQLRANFGRCLCRSCLERFMRDDAATRTEGL